MDKVDKDIENLLIDDDRISLYLQGKMSADEEASFVEELKTNDGLRQRAVAQARLIRGMKQADEELVDAFKQADRQTIINAIHKPKESANADFDSDRVKGFDSTEKELFSEDGTVERSKGRFSMRWLAYAASIILIVFVGFKGYDYYSTVNLGKQYANTFVLSEIVRGESNTDVEDELKTLFDNVIKGKDLRKTTERLEAIWQIAKQDTYNDYTDYAPYIGWYLAIGYLRDYEKLKANKILVEMNEMYPIGTSIGDGVKDVLRKCD